MSQPVALHITLRVKRYLDIAERVIWTLLEVGLAEALIAAFDMPQRWVLVFTPLLAAVKGALASKFGTSSAATLPAQLDAAARPAEPGADDSPGVPVGRHAAPEENQNSAGATTRMERS